MADAQGVRAEEPRIIDPVAALRCPGRAPYAAPAADPPHRHLQRHQP
ncbi:Uncharacterised protein [Escherichia coli]|nr:Uncharacterised protein [Escherichia coli]